MTTAIVILILHLGDPFPPVDVPYSYDSKKTEKDFERRRKEIETIERKQKYKYAPLCKT